MNEIDNSVSRGTLSGNEPHPAYNYAVKYIVSIPYEELCIIRESFSSCAIEGNRLGEICSETLHRIMNHEPVSDRYVMGLALAIMEIRKNETNG